jgi:enoyl-CoA hydratase
VSALVTYERDGAIGTLTLCHPPLNIITAAVRDEFLTCLERIRGDAALRALILTGGGERAFCAGADLREEEALDAGTVRRFLEEDRAVYDSVEQLAIPVIAAVNGHCMGGGLELALACDIRVAAEDAKLRGAGVRVGLVASTARLTRLAGPAIAKDLLLTGRTFDGREALRLGLASAAMPLDRLMDEARAWAGQIAARAPLAVRHTKRAIEEAADLPFPDGLDRELDHFAELAVTEDHKAALAAFFRREEPVFHGR